MTVMRSQELEESINHALEKARVSKSQLVYAEDLVMALLERSASARQMLEAHRVDPEKVKVAVAAWREGRSHRVSGDEDAPPQPMLCFNRVLSRAEVNVVKTIGAATVTGADVLAAMLGENISVSARILRKAGMRAAAVNRYVRDLPRE